MPFSLHRVVPFPSIQEPSEILSLNNNLRYSLYPGYIITGEASFHHIFICDTDSDGTELVSHWAIYQIIEDTPKGTGPLFWLWGVFHSVSKVKPQQLSRPEDNMEQYISSQFIHSPTNMYYTLTTYQALCWAMKQRWKGNHLSSKSTQLPQGQKK